MIACIWPAGAVLTTVCLGFGARPSAAQQPGASGGVALVGVTVVDVRDGRLHTDQTVVIAGTRIAAVGPAARVRAPAGAHVVQARGKYLIPGFWDMHTHPACYPDVFFPLFIANGVTGIRDMASPMPLDTLRRWKQEIASGARVGPRLLVAGPSLNNAGSGMGGASTLCGGRQHQISVTTPAEARRVVDSLKAAGADLIKVYEGLSREVYLALLAEARRVGLPPGGHLISNLTAEEASDSGIRTIEHFFGMRKSGCVGDSADLAQCARLAQRFARNDTWWVSSAVVAVGSYLSWQRGPRRYWPASLLQQLGFDSTSQFRAPYSAVLPADLGLAAMERAQMPVLAGTDAAPIFVGLVPGFALHDELALLVSGGLTPLTALQAATLNPAKAYHATDSLGTVARGKLADLVLLDGNPLQDIHNTATIRAVVANGRYFDRDALDRLLAQVEQAASRQ